MLRLIEVIGLLPYASNTTLLAADPDGGKWVYKPADGEQPLWDFEHRSLAAREILVYEVSAAMGLEIVPVTVESEGPYGFGSAQAFLDEDMEFDPRPLFRAGIDPILWPFAVLDVVVNNADRKLGHILRNRGDGRLWAIDNGLSFHPMEKLRTVLWGFSGQRIPVELCLALDQLAGALETGLGDRVADLLGPVEADILAARVASLKAHPIHPHPPEDRPAVPWPMW